MPLLDLTRQLPSRYYLTHFRAMLADLTHLYGHWLTAEEHAWLQGLDQLPEPALCLYLRLVNRKGLCFNPSQLNYAEVGHVAEAADPLLADGLLLAPPADAMAALSAWDAPLLKALAGAFLVDGLHRCHSKKRLLAGLANSAHLPDMLAYGLRYFGPLWQIQHKPLWHWLLFLYFGQPETNLARFAVHDLRLTQPDSPPQLTPLFADRADAVMAYTWHQRVSLPVADFNPEALGQLVSLPYSPASEPIRHQYLMQTAAQLEKKLQLDDAMALYQAVPLAAARIRQFKLLKKTGRLSDALTLAAERATQTQDVEEAVYVERLLTRHKRAVPPPPVPEQLISLPAPEGTPIERHVLTHMASQGWHGLHAENWLWRCLFGLTFWDELHQNGVFHHRLQVASRDLRHGPAFWQTRQAALHQRLNLLSDPATWHALLAMTHWRHAGKPNALVSWSPEVIPTLAVWMQQLPLAGLKAVLLQMAQHMESLTCGLPDLFVWQAGQCAFIEVKSPRDRLSAVQTYWIRFFQQHQLPVWVLKVNYG